MVKLFVDDKNICELKATSKAEAIGELIKGAGAFSSMGNTDIFREEVLQRERNMSTGIGRGIAVAHGNYNGGKDIKIALGISKEGIFFDSIDNEPVYMLFLIATPPGTWSDYLNILAHIVGLVRGKVILSEILKDQSPASLAAFFKNYARQ